MAHVLTCCVRVLRRFHESPERVFGAWLDADVARRWLFATAAQPMTEVEIDASVGGPFRFVDGRRNVEHTGVFLEIDAPRRLVFGLSLEGEPRAATRVSVEIVRNLDNCTVALVHEGVPIARARYIANRWCGMLYGLGETLESTRRVPPCRTRRIIA
jgi:uncharacterized protein YndB with AHSA1/START domain